MLSIALWIDRSVNCARLKRAAVPDPFSQHGVHLLASVSGELRFGRISDLEFLPAWRGGVSRYLATWRSWDLFNLDHTRN